MSVPLRLRRTARRLPAALVALGVCLGSSGAMPALAAEPTGSLTIHLRGELGNPGPRVTGACFNVYGYENGTPSVDIAEGVCDTDDGTLELHGLEIPPDGIYHVVEYQAPTFIVGENGAPDYQAYAWGRAAWFDVAAGSTHDLWHAPGGTGTVVAKGPTSEDDPTVREFTPCVSITRHTPDQPLGLYCNDGVLPPLEPDDYTFTTYPFEDHLGGSVDHFIDPGSDNQVVVPVGIAPDYDVTTVDGNGEPLDGACYDLIAVDVPGWESGQQAASACDEYPGPNDGRTTFVDLEPGSYTLVQVATASGYETTADTPISVHGQVICDADTCPAPNAVTVTNLPLPVLQVRSVGPDGAPAPGGCYELGRYEDQPSDEEPTLAEQTEQYFDVSAYTCDGYDGNEDGISRLVDFHRGEYVLREGYAPAGMRQAAEQALTITGNLEVTITHLREGNSAPVAVADSATTPQATAVTGNALANDSDPDGDPLTATLAGAPARGTAVVAPDGSWTYTPEAAFSGEDSFTYTVTDGVDTSTGTVTVTVTPVTGGGGDGGGDGGDGGGGGGGGDPVQHAPTANDDAATTDEDTAVTGNVLTNDTDVDGDTLTAALSSEPQHGTVALDADGSWTYTPDPDFAGSDTFSYTATDGASAVPADVALTVTPVNDAPVAVADAGTTEQGTPVVGNVLSNDTDVEGAALTATVLTAPAHGTVTLAPDGAWTYTPAADFSGTDSFTYTVSDGTDTAIGSVTLTVTPASSEVPVTAAVAALRSMIDTLPAPLEGQLGKMLDQVVRHTDTGKASCAHTGRLEKAVSNRGFVGTIGAARAEQFQVAVTRLMQSLGCARA